METWWNESAAIFVDIVDLRAAIDSVEFNHIPREAYKVAHEIARVCYVEKITCIWDDDPPSFLIGSLIDDVTIDNG